jgi:hypothetical protein
VGVIADILRRHAPVALTNCARRVPARWYRAVQRIIRCRTVRMGGCVDTCPDCAHAEFVPYSCRDRLCPVCRGSEAASWLEARRRELLPVKYFHFVVTVPTAYSRAVHDHPQALGKELMQAVAEASQAVAADRHSGELGILAVLHTSGRNLSWHAHVHCLIPGVVLRADGSYKVLRGRFLIPLGAFRKVFPAILTGRFRKALPGFDPPGRVWRQKWNAKILAYLKGPDIVLKYLARYVRSGPLHEAQIQRADDQQVAFRYLDHRTKKVKVWRGVPETFVCRYLQHALPRGLHRIRYYGFLGPSRRRVLRSLQVALASRAAPSALAPEMPERPDPGPLPCPVCGSIRPRVRRHIGPALALLRFGNLSRAPPRLAS